MSKHPTRPISAAWWATTAAGLSVRARLAVMVLVLALATVTYVVWISPGVRAPLDGAVAAAKPTKTAEQIRLEAENARLLGQVAALRKGSEAQRDAEAKAALEREAGRASGEAKAAAEQAAAAANGKARGATARAAAAAGTGGGDGDGAANPSNPKLPEAPADATGPKPVTPTRAELVNPPTRYFGLYTVQSPFSWATLDDVSAKVARTPGVAGYFQGWDRPFRPDAVLRSWQRGMLPLLMWESRPVSAGNNQSVDPDFSLPAIIGDPASGVPGRYDDYLREYARGIAALGMPLAIRLDHEMNGSWYPWSELKSNRDSLNGNRVGDFVKMWRHVHEIFEAEGANAHVIWVWAPNIVNNLPDWAQNVSYLRSLYPGDEYVDWTGLSGYQRPPFRNGNDATFQFTFDRSLAQLRDITHKPVLLAEVGASEIGGTKPAWVKSFFQAFTRSENADLVGFAWFNLTVTTVSKGQLVTNDWRVDSRSNSLAAFKAGVNNPAARFGLPFVAPAAVAPAAGTATAAPTPTPSPTQTPTPTPDPTATTAAP